MSGNKELSQSDPARFRDPSYAWPGRRWAVFHADRNTAYIIARHWTRRGARARSWRLQIANHRYSGTPGRFAVGRVR